MSIICKKEEVCNFLAAATCYSLAYLPVISFCLFQFTMRSLLDEKYIVLFFIFLLFLINSLIFIDFHWFFWKKLLQQVAAAYKFAATNWNFKRSMERHWKQFILSFNDTQLYILLYIGICSIWLPWLLQFAANRCPETKDHLKNGKST